MLTEFNFHAPSFVVAGRNSVHQTGELLNQWGAGKNIMVVCGNSRHVMFFGIGDAAAHSLHRRVRQRAMEDTRREASAADAVQQRIQ